MGHVDILYETDTELYWGYISLNDPPRTNHIVKELYKTDKARFYELKMNAPDPVPDNYIDEEDMEFERLNKIANADYGTCYEIGNYMLCPEQKLIRTGRMFGTATKDCFGYFPDPTLKYDTDTMIIFGGLAFFDKSGLNIDWEIVELLACGDHNSVFTDGKTLYYISYGNISTNGERYDKNTYKPDIEKRLPHRKNNELTESFYVRGDTFYYNRIPILEPFDVANLRTVVSKSGFESNYITDGRRVLFGGGKTGYSTTEKDGKEYVVTERWMVEGIDLPSLCVLGRDLLADKNALYCGTNVIPFDKLGGFTFIIREM